MRDTRGMNRFASVLKGNENGAQSISQKSPIKINNIDKEMAIDQTESSENQISEKENIDKSIQRTSDSGFNDGCNPNDANADTEMIVENNDLSEHAERETSAKVKTVQIEMNVNNDGNDDDADDVGVEKNVNELNEINENITKTVENNENYEVMETTEERSTRINGVNDDNNGDELNSRIIVDDNKRTELSSANKNVISTNEKSSATTNKRKISISSNTPPSKR